MTDDLSLPAKESASFQQLKVTASFQQLKVAADQLNAVSDELGKSIKTLDAALEPLNLGISTWVLVEEDEDDRNGEYTAHDLGYAKIRSEWGIALRTRDGNHFSEEERGHEQWLFNNAPRALRIKAIDKLPELLEKLIREANATAGKIKDKVGQAQQVAQASAAARAIEQRRK